jgi:hypothetical protein
MSIGFLRREGVSLMRNLIFGAMLLPAVAVGQGFNVDLDVFDGGPIVGEGSPSDAFGGAANQPGRWNQVNGSFHGMTRLLNLNGSLSNVFMSMNGIIQRGGWNNPLNTGDYRLLFNDATLVYGQVQWSVTGLSQSWYRVIVYAVSPVPQHNQPRPIEVFVDGSTSTNPQIVTGPMPGNSFQYLVTHSIHDVLVLDGQLRFGVTTTIQNEDQHINGFQISPVPESGTLAILAPGVVWLWTLRRRPIRR